MEYFEQIVPTRRLSPQKQVTHDLPKKDDFICVVVKFSA